MELDRSKFVTPEVAAERAVRSGDWVDYGFGGGYPELMDRGAGRPKGRLTDVEDPRRTGHPPQDRGGGVRPGADLLPLLQLAPGGLRAEAAGPWPGPVPAHDPALPCPASTGTGTSAATRHLSPVSLPDDQGYCGLGISNYAWRTIFQSARTVVFEINERLPRLQGVDGSHRVHLSEADYIVEGEHEPLPLRTYRDPSPTDLRIAQLVAQEIPDGAVLSLGVGSVPFAVASMLADSDIKDLGCHTGTISDAFLRLFQKGKLTNSRKEVDRGYATWNLAHGSQELYDWLDREPGLFRPSDVDYVHSPERIGQMSNVISINGGVELDLMGQENAESAGARQLSGIGGQLDFLEGAFRSKGGKELICLNSTHQKKDGTLKSNIVPCIPAGSVVSAPVP